MSIFLLTVVGLLCASICQSALPPRDVYSAVIVNQGGLISDCHISWSGHPNLSTLSESFRLEKYQSYVVQERNFDMGTWQGRGIITAITCDGVSIRAPFDKVTGPTTNWKFVLKTNRIESVGSA